MKVLEAPSDEVMDYRGLSVYLKMAEGTLRHKVMRREIPYIKIGHSVRFAKKRIDQWLTEQERKSQQVKGKGKEESGDSSGGLFPGNGG